MRKIIALIIIHWITVDLYAQHSAVLNLNKPEREEWFSNLGFGMFIHWSFDVELGMVISHSAVGASEDYLDRYFNELPLRFNPKNFDPSQWAKIARYAGMKYVVFTTKHHSGFCMFETPTTDFKVTNTPFGKDVTKEVLDAFRKEGLAIGIYFSPDDFHFLYKQRVPISRRRPEAVASGNPALNEFDKTQLRELLTGYKPIDIVFLDGADTYAKTELAKVCWEIDPEVVVTRGAMGTPEQKLPDQPLPSPWEACYTMGNQWQFRPTNENYKSAHQIITMLIETRAKGGNLLLNVGPTADGEIPGDQKAVLNEVALWMFINKESMENIVPWPVIKENSIWLTKSKNGNTVYAYLVEKGWEYGKEKVFILNTVKPTANTKISVLGHGGKILEYQPDVNPEPYFSTTEMGMQITAMRAQRIYNDRKWPNPIVIKIENVEFREE